MGAIHGHHGLMMGVITPSMASYNDLVVAAAPVIRWRLEETTGTTAASSGSSGVSGTITGGADFSTAGIVAGSGIAGVGRGIDLAVPSAADVRAVGLSGASLNSLGGSGSSGAWTIIIICAGGSGSGYLASRVNDFAVIHNFVSGQVEFFSLGYGGANPRTGSQITLSNSDTTTPHMIAYRYDNGTWSGLLDGVEVFSVSCSFGLATTETAFYLGSDSGSSVADRKIWDVQTYDRAVSTTDLLAMWDNRNS